MVRVVTMSTGFPPPRPTLRTRVAGWATLIVALTLIGGILAIALPIALAIFAISAVLGLVVIAFLVLRLRLRQWWSRQSAPNGPLDGRRNVRVRMPGERGEGDVVQDDPADSR